MTDRRLLLAYAAVCMLVLGALGVIGWIVYFSFAFR